MSEKQEKQERQLTAEIEAFERLQPRLQFDHPEGGFVVIKDGEVLGVWRDRVDALGEGIKEYGDVVFLVRDIRDTGEPIHFSRDIFGIGGGGV